MPAKWLVPAFFTTEMFKVTYFNNFFRYIYISSNGVAQSINKCELNGLFCRVLVDSGIPKIISYRIDMTSKPRKCVKI